MKGATKKKGLSFLMRRCWREVWEGGSVQTGVRMRTSSITHPSPGRTLQGKPVAPWFSLMDSLSERSVPQFAPHPFCDQISLFFGPNYDESHLFVSIVHIHFRLIGLSAGRADAVPDVAVACSSVVGQLPSSLTTYLTICSLSGKKKFPAFHFSRWCANNQPGRASRTEQPR